MYLRGELRGTPDGPLKATAGKPSRLAPARTGHSVLLRTSELGTLRARHAAIRSSRKLDAEKDGYYN